VLPRSMYRSGPPMMSVVGSADRECKTCEADGAACLVYTFLVVNNHKYPGADKFRDSTVYTSLTFWCRNFLLNFSTLCI
jgi:hypothetical protein